MNHDNKPLTVDQMREMHDEVVIVKTLEYGQESKGILDFSDPNDSDNGVYVGCSFYSVEHYGDWLLAYAQKPIDWDAWKPCFFCKVGACETCEHHVSSCSFDPCKSCNIHNHKNYYRPLNFCPHCGRPLTDKARELLERRLRSSDNE